MLSNGSRVYSGTVTNISEKGMFIDTGVSGFAEDSKFEISIPLKEGILHVPGKLVRLSKINGGSNGMGVELMDPPQNYLEFVENLLYVL